MNNFTREQKRLYVYTLTEFFERIRDWSIEKYNLDKFKPSLRIDWSKHRQSHWGGQLTYGIGISLGMGIFDYSGNEITYEEYARFNDDPEIGALTTTDWLIAAKCDLCHEMAHCIQAKLNDGDANHNKTFQRFYRDLRTTFVNPLLLGDNYENDM